MITLILITVGETEIFADVALERPLIGQSRRSSVKTGASTDYGSHTSTIKWKNHSSTSNNLTTTITKSSSSKTTTFDADSSRIVIAVSAGRGEASYEVGIAALDVCKPTLILCQISDMPSYINTLTKINILNPDEILIPMTFVETSSSSRLVTKIKQHFKNTIITAIPRATYNKQSGMQYIKEFCAPQWDSIFLILQHKYYCLTAASALFTYTESSLFVIYNKQSLKVEYQESEGYCTIDVSTADKLELVAPNTATSNERYASLYGILNYCLTKIGARTLRATILQPSCSIPDIEARLDCVTELKKNSNMMMAVQTILPKISNIDQLLSLATLPSDQGETFLPKISNIDQLLSLATLPSDQGETFTERHLMYVLTLNALLNLLEPLKEIFEDSQQPFFKEIRTTLENALLNLLEPLKEIFEDSQQPFFKEIRTTLENETFNDLTHIVRTIIQPDAHPAKGQQGIIEKCFLIKPGVNGLLDVLRKTYSERVEDLRGENYLLSEGY
ncbi:MutS domain II [Popillia japonica]|uniref:MutS domain II n=1 Tax=Popillia japonica TaxID=7064 RepID=A0AAW1MAU0_POPJA